MTGTRASLMRQRVRNQALMGAFNMAVRQFEGTLMKIIDDVEMLINASGDVAVFMLPVKARPSATKIEDNQVSILSEDKLVAKFEAPENFLDRLRETETILVVECVPTRTFRETDIPLK
jgi:hypothetical protein